MPLALNYIQILHSLQRVWDLRKNAPWPLFYHLPCGFVLSWSWVIYHYKLGGANEVLIKLSPKVNEISSYQTHRLSIAWPLSLMSSGVNNRVITNTKNAHDWPLPKLQASLPASRTGQWCLIKTWQQIIQGGSTGRCSKVFSGLLPMLMRCKGCLLTNETHIGKPSCESRGSPPPLLSPGSPKLPS